jgi:Rrf2 family protein
MLSLTCKTAIKAVIYLGSKFELDEKAGIKEIADYIDASELTVGKLLQTLVKQKVINSSKGPNGGFYITARQMYQPLLRIIDAIDGKEIFSECGLGLSKCSATHPCPIHNDYRKIRDQFKELCQQKKVNDVCERVSDGLAYLIG